MNRFDGGQRPAGRGALLDGNSACAANDACVHAAAAFACALTPYRRLKAHVSVYFAMPPGACRCI